MLNPLSALQAMHFQDSLAFVRSVCIALIALGFTSPAMAEKGKLRERLTPEVMAVVYPGAERLGLEEGSPPAIAVFKGDQIVAYVFSTLDIIAAPGYSTTPFDVIAGVDLGRSEEHTSELQSLAYIVCRLLLEKKKVRSSLLQCTLIRSSSRS